MFQNNNNQYVAIFDAEYTANTNESKGIQEMIQCALFIYKPTYLKESFKLDGPICKYVSFIQTTYNKELSEFVTDLTGITKKDVENGVTLFSAMNEINRLINEYKIKKIYVWGPDEPIIRYNLRLIDYPRTQSKYFLSRINDISDTISKHLDNKRTISQLKACEICDIEPVGKPHTAESDTQTLAKLLEKNYKIIFK